MPTAMGRVVCFLNSTNQHTHGYRYCSFRCCHAMAAQTTKQLVPSVTSTDEHSKAIHDSLTRTQHCAVDPWWSMQSVCCVAGAGICLLINRAGRQQVDGSS
jgi:hypothetical protein